MDVAGGVREIGGRISTEASGHKCQNAFPQQSEPAGRGLSTWGGGNLIDPILDPDERADTTGTDERTLGEPDLSTISASGMREQTSSPPAVTSSSSAADAGRLWCGRQKVLWRKQRRQGSPPSPVVLLVVVGEMAMVRVSGWEGSDVASHDAAARVRPFQFARPNPRVPQHAFALHNRPSRGQGGPYNLP